MEGIRWWVEFIGLKALIREPDFEGFVIFLRNESFELASFITIIHLLLLQERALFPHETKQHLSSRFASLKRQSFSALPLASAAGLYQPSLIVQALRVEDVELEW